MDNKSYITLVDAHSEGDGRDDDLNFVVHPVALNLLTTIVGKLCVVKITLDPEVFFQIVS